MASVVTWLALDKLWQMTFPGWGDDKKPEEVVLEGETGVLERTPSILPKIKMLD